MKVRPLSVNYHTISDVFNLVHALTASLFHMTQLRFWPLIVPADETTQILAEKTFKDDRFKKHHNLNIKTKSDLVELLNMATKSQLFQFEERLYEQTSSLRNP